MKIYKTDAGSFRDPSGFIFTFDGCLYRQVNNVYKENYDLLLESGLYQSLVEESLIVSHEEVNIEPASHDIAYKILKPQLIPFISYPFEWCFSQLKEAALLTLKIQKRALDYGMSLKDCSAYNIQFSDSRALFIDTLSFEKYSEGQLWPGYRQFCQHFLAPLALMSYRDVSLGQLLRIHIDGIPLALASKLLPLRSRFSFALLSHIHIHAKSQQHFADRAVNVSKKRKMSKFGFLGIIDSLETIIKKLRWSPKGTEWGEYYEDTNYSRNSMDRKEQLISDFLKIARPNVTWDMGANTGKWSRIAVNMGSRTISFDIDPAAVEKNYLDSVRPDEKNILPLILDLMNPSGGIGWANEERHSLIDRGPADTVLALALVHHLAISNNLPFNKISDFFCKICNYLIIEFVPKNDSQVMRLLSSREDIFPDYTRDAFEAEFGKDFVIKRAENIQGSERTLYLMERKKIENQ